MFINLASRDSDRFTDFYILKQTLPAKRPIERRGKGRRSPSEPEPCSNAYEELRTDTHQPNLGFKDLLSIPIIRDLTLCGFSLDVNGTSFAIVFALFCYSPIEHGGLAFPVCSILSFDVDLTDLPFLAHDDWIYFCFNWDRGRVDAGYGIASTSSSV